MPDTITDRFRRFEQRKNIYLDDGTDLQLKKRKNSRSGRVDKAQRVRKLEERVRLFQQQRPLREAKLALLSPFGNTTRIVEELAQQLGVDEHSAVKQFWNYLTIKERKSLSLLLKPWLGVSS